MAPLLKAGGRRNQSYCSSPACQRARRQRWQRDKMQADPDCRENQLRSQYAWLERRPEYCVTTTTSIQNTCSVLDWPMIWGMLGNDLDGRAAIDQG